MNHFKILIIVPAFNVSEKLETVLHDLLVYQKDTIIIDDGSTDETLEIIKKNRFQFIAHQHNIGMGGAIKTGIKYGIEKGYSHAISLDADGQHCPLYIEVFKQKLTICDFVIGCRFHLDSVNEIPSAKLSSNFMGAAITHELFESVIKDISCGYRGFKLSQANLQIAGNGFNFVFQQLFQVLNSQTKFMTVNMPAVYPLDELMSTRVEEILCFFEAIYPYVYGKKLEEKITSLVDSIAAKRDFHFKIDIWTFYGFYLEYNNSYIIQTEIKKAKDFFVHT
ncbi:hypothetical protein GCM10027049_01570 [Mucilaginibacter puniceus]